MVISPSGAKFAIDVKGLYKKSFWLISPKTVLPDLFYILAYVPDDGPNEFFILSQDEANTGVANYVQRLRVERQRKGLSIDKTDRFQGLLWSVAERYKDQWDKLPR